MLSDSQELFEVKGLITAKKGNVLEIWETCKDPISYSVQCSAAYNFIVEHTAIGDAIYCLVSEEWYKPKSAIKDIHTSNSESSSSDGYISSEDTSEECILHMAEVPLVTSVLNEKKPIISAMIRAVRIIKDGKSSLIVSIPVLLAIYGHIAKTHKDISVSSYLSRKANQYNRCHRDEVSQSILYSYSGKLQINSSHIFNLLKGWYKTNDLRLLYLMRLDDGEIRKSLIRPDLLYERLISNPLSIHNIPYDKALQLANTLKIEYTSVQLEAGLYLRTLSKRTIGNANSYIDVSKFFRTNKPTEDVLKEMIKTSCVVDGNKLYITEVRDMEESVASSFATFMNADIKASAIHQDIRSNDGKVLDSEQTKAINTALTKNISIITGAAGTGKTTIIKNLVSSLRESGVTFACTSFTGKATARIEECCDVDAVNMDTMIVRRDEFKFDHLIIDEYSMTSIELMYLFFCAFPGPYRITLIGDINQLEPINFGSVLQEMIISNTIPVTRLKIIYRVITGEGQTDRIVENSKRIAYWGDKPFDFIQGDNFQVKSGDVSDVISEIIRLRRIGFKLSDFVVISPYTEPNPIINRSVQYIFNKCSPCVVKTSIGRWEYYPSYADKDNATSKNTIYHIGDLVMASKNCKMVKMHNGQVVYLDIYRKNPKMINIYNGQEGIVTNVELTGVTVKFRTDEVIFPLATSQLNAANTANTSYISLCYSVTTHKMQGSQRKRVIYFLYKCTKFITRSITYTSITRASNSVLIIGEPSSINRSIENISRKKTEHLCGRLRDKLPEDYKVIEEDEMAKELIERENLLDKRFKEEYGEDDNNDYYDDDY